MEMVVEFQSLWRHFEWKVYVKLILFQEGLYDVADILEDGVFIVKINEEEEAERYGIVTLIFQMQKEICFLKVLYNSFSFSYWFTLINTPFYATPCNKAHD